MRFLTEYEKFYTQKKNIIVANVKKFTENMDQEKTNT